MYGKIQEHFSNEIKEIKDNGLFKKERIITSPQGAVIKISSGEEVINFCANNYLGLASHPRINRAAKEAIDSHGFGTASVRLICGTNDKHKELEAKLSKFHKMDDTILYTSCYDANVSLF